MDWTRPFKRFGTTTGATRVSRFGYAVVGLGRIAEYFLEALADSPTCTVAALVSGSPDKARRMASKYRVAHVFSYEDYAKLRHLREVDAVYLALPVSMHREFTERSAAAGKHVLCEKPMASTARGAAMMIATCKAADVKLSVAYRCPHTHVHQRARHLIHSGALGLHGSLRIESAFGFKLGPDWRTDAALAGGGSLYDVGIYPLNAARYLLGEDPVGVQDANAVCDAAGLERSIRWTSIFPSGATAVCRSSYAETLHDTLRVSGSRGTLLLAPAFSHRERLRLRGSYTDAAGKVVEVDEQTSPRSASQFRLEAEQLADSVRLGTELMTPGEDGLADMMAMEEIYRMAAVSLQNEPGPSRSA